MLATLMARLRGTAELDCDDHAPVVVMQDRPALHCCTPGVDCEDCPNGDLDSTLLPLCQVKQGQSVRIVTIDAGRRFRKRLADLGLAAGAEVRVMQAPHASGPMILAVRSDTRLALRQCAARKIWVEDHRA
jgi:Fe2+ transport system protein FeoA